MSFSKLANLFIEYRDHFGLEDEEHLDKQMQFEDEFCEIVCGFRGHIFCSDLCKKPEHDFCSFCGKRREDVTMS